MKAFEIHTYRDGKWRIDSMFDDRDIAVYEAERMDSSGRYSSVRVIEEIYDEERDEARTRTIYRGQRAAQEAADRLEESRKKRTSTRTPRHGGGGGEVRARARVEKKKSNSLTGVVMILALLGVLGIALLIGLRYMQELV